MRVLLDFDSTTADTFTEQIRLLNQQFGKKYQPSDFYTWKSEDILPPEEVAFLWGEDCFLDLSFQWNVHPVANAIETIKDLMALGIEFVIASDRPDCLYDVTRGWLNKYGLYAIDLHFTHHPSSLAVPSEDNSSRTKLDIINDLGLEWAIDDAGHHATEFIEHTNLQRVLLIDSYHNKHIQGEQITRCFGWDDVYEEFEWHAFQNKSSSMFFTESLPELQGTYPDPVTIERRVVESGPVHMKLVLGG